MTTNDSSTPKKAENAQVQAVRKEFTVSGDEQNLDPAALGSRSPLELLADVQEVAQSIARTRRDWEGSLLERRLSALEFALRAQAEAGSFQERAANWVREAFGSEPADCREERAHRFLEEALEAVQAAGTTAQEARQLVEYVYGRERGELSQEIGGVMLTLAPFAAAHAIDLEQAGEVELARVNTPEIIAKCRRKNASKLRNSPLPGSAALAQARNAPAPAPRVCKFHGKTCCGPEDGFACMSPMCFVPAQSGAGGED